MWAMARAPFARLAVATATKTTWWGYDTTQVDDPDGNELFFPVPD